MIGAAIGLAGRAAWLGVKGIGAVAGPAMRTAFAVGTPVAKTALWGGGKAVGFGLRHPELAMTMGVGALGVYGAMQMGAQASNLGEDEVNILARMTGPSTGFTPGMGSMAYDPRRMILQDSTQGLVQGLHRGRH